MANKVTSFQVQNKDYHVDPDLTFDGFPTEGSSNPVTSNGIFVALQGAVIGDNISYGRTTGSPVGYCSISYGKNNIAAQDYSITFGEDNTNISKWSIISGQSTKTHGHANFSFGSYNSIFGHYSGTMGDYNVCGFTFDNASPLSTENAENNIYVGYINLNTKKIYSDEAMQTPINIPLENHQTCYVLDLTNNTNQHAGDVYEYYRNGSSYTLTYIVNAAVNLTNVCCSIGYVYNGIAYYKASNDTLYSDSGYTTTIAPIYDAGNGYKYLYFDPLLREFITPTKQVYSMNIPKWMKVKVYKTGYLTDSSNKYNFVGRFAYINTKDSYRRVYTSSDFEESTEITNNLYDGEIVADYSSGSRYKYRLDSSNNYICYDDMSDTSGSSRYNPRVSNCGLAIGTGNNINAFTTGAIACGNGNHIFGMGEGASIFGLNNSHFIYNEHGGASFITGEFNSAFSPSGGKGFALIGGYNTIKLSYHLGYFGASSGCRYSILGGYYNNCKGNSAYCNYLFGAYNTTTTSDYILTFGMNNTVYESSQSLINGFYNTVGDLGGGQYNKFAPLTQNKSGIYEGNDVSYNASTGMYTFPTDRIFKMYVWTSGGSKDETTFVGYYVSTDTHNLTPISSSFVKPNYNTVIGYTNNHYRKIDTVADINDQSQYNYILGAYNDIYARNMKSVGAIGYHLKVNYSNDNAPEGAIFLGAYNSMGETTNAQVIVGIGTSDSERSNGFVVYKNGITAAPACPDTVSAASSAAAADGIDAGKVLVSYAMLQDYTAPGGGGSSRPTVTVLNLEAANWSNEELTESLPNITEDSIIIIQPSGNPHAFYTDEIYLKSQGEGEVTFGCSVVPSVDITVKVVYWV